MSLKLLASISFVSLGILLFVSDCRADLLDDATSTKYGRLVSISDGIVVFDVGCDAKRRISVPLSGLQYFDRNGVCTPPPPRRPIPAPLSPPPPPPPPCPTKEVAVLTIYFDGSGPSYATSIEVLNGRVTLGITNPARTVSGPLQDVSSIGQRTRCVAQLDLSVWPKSFH
jgi:hypothetical protein